MNKGLTVEELFECCKKQIEKGNGDKHIQITTDDEGNGYHTLFYQFNDDKEEIVQCIAGGLMHDAVNPDEIVLLG